MEESDIRNAVFDYFSGRATPLQKQAINVWLEDPSHHDQYYSWLHKWELDHLQAPASWQNAYARTQHRVTHRTLPAESTLPSGNTGPWYSREFRIAAAFVLLSALGISLYLMRDTILYTTVQATYGETKHTMLPDGSQVSLNANSSIRYARFGFGRGQREVSLSGEADFEISRTPDRKLFVVSTSTGLKVTVLGTAFTVFARPRGSQVTLRSGKVALQADRKRADPDIIMAPGDIVSINTAGELSRSHTSRPEHVSSWKEHMITLDRTSLLEISAILEEIYGFRVELNEPELGTRTATGMLPIQNAETALELVSDMFAIHFHREDDKIIFKN